METLDVTLAERGQKVALDLSRWVGKALDDGLSRDEALTELRGRPVPWPKASDQDNTP